MDQHPTVLLIEDTLSVAGLLPQLERHDVCVRSTKLKAIDDVLDQDRPDVIVIGLPAFAERTCPPLLRLRLKLARMSVEPPIVAVAPWHERDQVPARSLVQASVPDELPIAALAHRLSVLAKRAAQGQPLESRTSGASIHPRPLSAASRHQAMPQARAVAPQAGKIPAAHTPAAHTLASSRQVGAKAEIVELPAVSNNQATRQAGPAKLASPGTHAKKLASTDTENASPAAKRASTLPLSTTFTHGRAAVAKIATRPHADALSSRATPAVRPQIEDDATSAGKEAPPTPRQSAPQLSDELNSDWDDSQTARYSIASLTQHQKKAEEASQQSAVDSLSPRRATAGTSPSAIRVPLTSPGQPSSGLRVALIDHDVTRVDAMTMTLRAKRVQVHPLSPELSCLHLRLLRRFSPHALLVDEEQMTTRAAELLSFVRRDPFLRNAQLVPLRMERLFRTTTGATSLDSVYPLLAPLGKAEVALFEKLGPTCEVELSLDEVPAHLLLKLLANRSIWTELQCSVDDQRMNWTIGHGACSMAELARPDAPSRMLYADDALTWLLEHGHANIIVTQRPDIEVADSHELISVIDAKLDSWDVPLYTPSNYPPAPSAPVWSQPVAYAGAQRGYAGSTGQGQQSPPPSAPSYPPPSQPMTQLPPSAPVPRFSVAEFAIDDAPASSLSAPPVAASSAAQLAKPRSSRWLLAAIVTCGIAGMGWMARPHLVPEMQRLGLLAKTRDALVKTAVAQPSPQQADAEPSATTLVPNTAAPTAPTGASTGVDVLATTSAISATVDQDAPDLQQDSTLRAPGYSSALLVRGMCQQAACAVSESDLDVRDKPRVSQRLINEARHLLVEGQNEQARVQLCRASALDPAGPAAVTLGHFYLENHCPELAAQVSELARERGASERDVLLFSADLESQNGDDEASRVLLLEAIGVAQSESAKLEAVSRKYESDAQLALKHALLTHAERDLRRAVATWPENWRAAGQLARTLERQGLLEQALNLAVLVQQNDASEEQSHGVVERLSVALPQAR